MKLLNNFYHHYLFKKSEFVHFISKVHPTLLVKDQAWVYFKLGMYSTVNSLRFSNHVSINELLAHAASAAACDDHVKLNEAITLYEKNFSDQIDLLIQHVASFDVTCAFRLARKYGVISSHTVALLIRQQQYQEASTYLSKLKSNINVSVKNTALLSAQLHYFTDKTRILDDINEIYQYYKLVNLKLKNQNLPINVANILAATTPQNLKIKQNALISILITTYNCENYILSTLESLIQQTYTHTEIIIVDDCSTDTTVNIIKNFASKHKNIRIYRQPLNLGTYVAKNRALLMAKGEFVICHDADDWSHPQRLELQIQPLLENKKIIATTSEWFRLSDDGEVYTRSIFPLSRLNPSSPLFRRKIVMKHLGFWDNVRTGADSEFLNRIKLFFGKNAIRKLDIPLAIGAHHAQSLMNAPLTGFTSQKIPLSRLEYWESWSQWHIQTTRNKSSLYMPLNPLKKQRKFDAPSRITLSDELLTQYQSHITYENSSEIL